jgi:cyclopropane fatty-acyl-phospholipid synthase-like methyltransferase
MWYCAETMDHLVITVENEVRRKHPELLKRFKVLTDDDWVLDSGCGFGLTKLTMIGY